MLRLSGIRDDIRQFQISIPVQPGNSGGPLVDMQGNVIGLVIGKLEDVAILNATGSLPQNVSYAIKNSYILAFLESIPNLHYILGVTTSAVNRMADAEVLPKVKRYIKLF